MKLFAALLAVLLLMPVSALAHPPLTAMENATVLVYGDVTETEDDGTVDRAYDIPYCSGVVIASSKTSETIATAGHCVAPTDGLVPKPSSVQFFNGDTGVVLATTSAPHDDFGLLYVRSMRRHTAARLTKSFHRAESLYVFGMPDGNDWSYSEATSMQGPLFTYSDAPWAFTYLIACASCAPGNSGSGVWDHNAHIVGILVAGGDAAETLIVPTTRIRAFLAFLNRHF